MTSSVAFNASRKKTIKNLIAALAKMYEKLSASNKIFLMIMLFNLNMAKSESVAEHLNEFNTLTSQLESVEINFHDEIRAPSLGFKSDEAILYCKCHYTEQLCGFSSSPLQSL